MELKKTPYEFLARWNDNGTLMGAHVVFREAITDVGVEISSKIGSPLVISIAGNAGFPLEQVLSALQASAVIKSEELSATLAEVTSLKEIAETEKTAAIQEATSLTEQLASSQTEVKAKVDTIVAITSEKDTAKEEIISLGVELQTVKNTTSMTIEQQLRDIDALKAEKASLEASLAEALAKSVPEDTPSN